MKGEVIGSIIDVYFEGEPGFRACVFDEAANNGLWVINLRNGEKRLVNEGEYEETTIKNIFTMVI